jgi:hypothetical protein
MTRYLNTRTNYGVETVGQLELKDFSDYKAFKVELRRLISEYSMCGMSVYSSQRCTKEWSAK